MSGLIQYYIEGLITAHDPTFNTYGIQSQIRQAGLALKKLLFYYIRSDTFQCDVEQFDKLAWDGEILEKFSGSSFATIVHLSHHFNNSNLTLTRNMLKNREIETIEDEDVKKLLDVAYILNPNDKDHSDYIIIINVWPNVKIDISMDD